MYEVIMHTNSEYFDVLDIGIPNFTKFGMDLGNTTLITDVKPKFDFKSTYIYENKLPYASRLLTALQTIDSSNVILLHEDFILYNTVQTNKLIELDGWLSKNPSYDFIRFMKSAESLDVKGPIENTWISTNQFAIQATLFRKDFLSSYLTKYSKHSIWDLEKEAKNNSHNGLYWYNNEPKRGAVHYDSSLFPCMATAVYKGRWCAEYVKELITMFPKFDFTKRGWV